MTLDTPVVFLIYRRPEHTRQVMRAIARARPRRLFVVADGPKAERAGDAELCARARAETEAVDWECDVERLYADSNMGCKARVQSGLNWAFEQTESAIILEDDCVPDPTFFPFCAELLERYRGDTRMMMISGNCYVQRPDLIAHSYYFSRYAHIQGWATWRRAWRLYDPAMKAWPEFRDGGWLNSMFSIRKERQRWRNFFEDAYNGKYDSWAFPWSFACYINSGFAIRPRSNLATNIGFDEMATHVKRKTPIANYPITPMAFPLQEPAIVARHAQADRDEAIFTMRLALRARAFDRVSGLLEAALCAIASPRNK